MLSATTIFWPSFQPIIQMNYNRLFIYVTVTFILNRFRWGEFGGTCYTRKAHISTNEKKKPGESSVSCKQYEYSVGSSPPTAYFTKWLRHSVHRLNLASPHFNRDRRHSVELCAIWDVRSVLSFIVWSDNELFRWCHISSQKLRWKCSHIEMPSIEWR